MGNPPYNAWQQDENDNNKNRKYEEVDRRVRNTYGADSAATLQNSLADPYIKALRWASDRIGEEGIVAYVTNSGFVASLCVAGRIIEVVSGMPYETFGLPLMTSFALLMASMSGPAIEKYEAV